MIKYKCPHCEEKLESLNADIGNQDTCPSCGHHFTVPERSGRGRKVFAVILLILAIGGVSFGWISSRNGKSESPAAENPPAQPVAKANPTPKPAPSPAPPKKAAPIPVADMSQFRELAEDYGVIVVHDKKSNHTGVPIHTVGFKIHPSIADGMIMFHLNPSKEINGITYIFSLSADMPEWEITQTLDVCNDLLARCPGWDSSVTPTIMQAFVQSLLDTDNDNKEPIKAYCESNGIKARILFTPGIPAFLNITRKTPLKEHREPLPYKPQFFGTDSSVGLWHLEWKKITKDEFSTTFSWRATVTNKGKTKHSYYLTCSVQDKDGFEIEKGYADTVSLSPGEHTSVTGRVIVMGKVAKKVSNFYVTAVVR